MQISKACPGMFKEASNTPAKGTLDMPKTTCEAVDGESWQAGGRSIGPASHPSGGALPSEKTRHPGTIGSAAHRPSRTPQIAPRRGGCTAGIPFGTRWAALRGPPAAIRKYEKGKSLLRQKGPGMVQGWDARSVSKSRGPEKVPGFDSHTMPLTGD